jgi:hypothetical protein
MKLRYVTVAFLGGIIMPAMAQELPAPDRRILALPFVVEQRNNANDALALCQADAQSAATDLRRQLAAANAKLAELNSQLETLKEPKP